MRKIILIALALGACSGPRPIVSTPPAACSALLPKSWSVGVEAEPIPTSPDISSMLGKPLTDVMAAYIAAPFAQAYAGADAKLAVANGRTSDAILVFANCETQVNSARLK